MSDEKKEVKNEEVKTNNLPEKQENVNNEVAKTEEQNETPLQTFDLTKGNLPDINNEETQAVPFDLMADYWSPEKQGEQKRVFFLKTGVRKVVDQTTGEILDLESAFFLEQKSTGEVIQISNGSKRLVGAITSNNIKKGTALLITYKGKKRNKTNSFSSDDWSIKPLIVNASAK